MIRDQGLQQEVSLVLCLEVDRHLTAKLKVYLERRELLIEASHHKTSFSELKLEVCQFNAKALETSRCTSDHLSQVNLYLVVRAQVLIQLEVEQNFGVLGLLFDDLALLL